jgi:hypothetical protein
MFVIMKLEHMFGGKIMKKNKFFRKILILSILCIILIPLTSKALSPNSTNATKLSYSKITVCSGDTLWTIASQNNSNNDDIREVVYNIKQINKLDSAIITPGQELLIPN